MIYNKKNSILIGITGGIASGKSTILKYLNEKGYSTINADKLGHKVLEKENSGYQKLLDTFGNEILNPNGSINRQQLGKIVFGNSEKLKTLNDISHPAIANMIKEEFKKSVLVSVDGIVFLEAALLIETNWYKFCGQTWVVLLDSSIASKRLQLRDGLSKKEAELRINIQINPEDRIAKADVVLKNNKTTGDLIFQTDQALEKLKNSRTTKSERKYNL